jgi:inorganic pyrophosphatase
MPKTAREPSVAEVKFAIEPSAKRTKDKIDTPGKDGGEKHPLKSIQRGAWVSFYAIRDVHCPTAPTPFSTRFGTRVLPPPNPPWFPTALADTRYLALTADTRFTLTQPKTATHPSGNSVLDLCVYKGDFDHAKLDPSQTGLLKSLEYRINFSHREKKISPWHDIPYRASPDTFHMMCEIPKWTRAKFEIATKEPGNPIKQDTKKGVLREYKHGDMLFNYGFMPQTWEDPCHVSEDTGFKGDDDPLDMVEIGCRQMRCGQVCEVKVLGVLAMIDDDETDWKVFCIRTDDPLAPQINDVEDIDKELPGLINTMREWFREYKVAEGKPLNKFALGEKCVDREYTEKVIEETHGFWKAAEARLRSHE